jgi:hypothetical protein
VIRSSTWASAIAIPSCAASSPWSVASISFSSDDCGICWRSLSSWLSCWSACAWESRPEFTWVRIWAST